MEHELNYKGFSEKLAKQVRDSHEKYKDQLNAYVDKLLWWNQKINLVSRDVSRETIIKHVEHSLAISVSELFVSAEMVVDAGTGGGLPGIPLAILSPEKRVVLNDVVSKKIMACKRMATELSLENVKAESRSIESVELEKGAIIISKHAFKVNDLYSMIRKKPWKGLVLLKGIDEVEGELEGVEESLIINVWDLKAGLMNEFYEGKAMIEIKRKGIDE